MKTFFLTGLLFLLPAAAYLQTYTAVSDVAAFQKKLKESSAQTTSIQTEFTQEKHVNILEKPVTSKGEFYYKKDNKIRWEILSPDPFLVVVNGTKVSVKSNSKVKTFDASSSKMFAQMNEIMSASVKGTILDDTDKYTAEYLESTGQYQLKLIPKEKKLKQHLSEIQIYFTKTHMDVAAIKLVEPNGDYTYITFYNKTLNGTIDDSKFMIKG